MGDLCRVAAGAECKTAARSANIGYVAQCRICPHECDMFLGALQMLENAAEQGTRPEMDPGKLSRVRRQDKLQGRGQARLRNSAEASVASEAAAREVPSGQDEPTSFRSTVSIFGRTKRERPMDNRSWLDKVQVCSQSMTGTMQVHVKRICCDVNHPSTGQARSECCPQTTAVRCSRCDSRQLHHACRCAAGLCITCVSLIGGSWLLMLGCSLTAPFSASMPALQVMMSLSSYLGPAESLCCDAGVSVLGVFKGRLQLGTDLLRSGCT